MREITKQAIACPVPMSEREWVVTWDAFSVEEGPYDVCVSVGENKRVLIRVARCSSKERAEETKRWFQEVYFGRDLQNKKYRG